MSKLISSTSPINNNQENPSYLQIFSWVFPAKYPTYCVLTLIESRLTCIRNCTIEKACILLLQITCKSISEEHNQFSHKHKIFCQVNISHQGKHGMKTANLEEIAIERTREYKSIQVSPIYSISLILIISMSDINSKKI